MSQSHLGLLLSFFRKPILAFTLFSVKLPKVGLPDYSLKFVMGLSHLKKEKTDWSKQFKKRVAQTHLFLISMVSEESPLFGSPKSEEHTFLCPPQLPEISESSYHP